MRHWRAKQLSVTWRALCPVGDGEQLKHFKQENEMRKSFYQNALSESNVEERFEGVGLETGRAVFEVVYLRVGEKLNLSNGGKNQVIEKDTARKAEWTHLEE